MAKPTNQIGFNWNQAQGSASSSYPVVLNVAGRQVLVVGGGRIAWRKAKGLTDAGAEVTVVAPQIVSEIESNPKIGCLHRPYREGEVANFRLAIACTDDPAVNRQVFEDGEAAGVWVNSADDPDNCSFTLPATARSGDLTISVSTGGKSPALAAWLRRRFESEFDARYQRLINLLSQTRAEVRATKGTSEIDGWLDALDDGLVDLIGSGRERHARDRLRSHLGLDPLTGNSAGQDTDIDLRASDSRAYERGGETHDLMNL